MSNRDTKLEDWKESVNEICRLIDPNELAARYNERYCQARKAMTEARNNKNEAERLKQQMEVEFIADLFDDYRQECEKMGVEITVELDYEGYEG